jgi:hypothetical protein
MVAADGSAPVFEEGMVLGLNVQRIRTEAGSADGVVPTTEMLQDVIGGEIGEGVEFLLGRSATELSGDFSDGTYDLPFVGHGMRQSKNALVQRPQREEHRVHGEARIQSERLGPRAGSEARVQTAPGPQSP